LPRSWTILIEVILQTFSESIQQTVQDFRSNCSHWQDEVHELFNDIDQFLGGQQIAVAGSLDLSVASNVADLKGLVEQQTDVLTALVNALTGPAAEDQFAEESDSGQLHRAESEEDPFERLQQVVAAVSESC
jgi:hypothetical protein